MVAACRIFSYSMWFLSSLTRDQTHPPPQPLHWKHGDPTTGLPGKSQYRQGLESIHWPEVPFLKLYQNFPVASPSFADFSTGSFLKYFPCPPFVQCRLRVIVLMKVIANICPSLDQFPNLGLSFLLLFPFIDIPFSSFQTPPTFWKFFLCQNREDSNRIYLIRSNWNSCSATSHKYLSIKLSDTFVRWGFLSIF